MNQSRHHSDTPIGKQGCYNCGYVMDETTAAFNDARSPKAGDVSICLNCGALAMFDDQMQLRPPTPEEKARVALDPRIIETQIARAAVVSRDLRR